MSDNARNLDSIAEEKKWLRSGAKLGSVHWLAFLGSLCITAGAWYYVKNQASNINQTAFDQESTQVIGLVSERMRHYEGALWAGAAAIQAMGGAATSEQWRIFVNNLKLNEKFPGISGVGVANYLSSPEALTNYVTKKRATSPDYKVFPKHKKLDYLPVEHIEPANNETSSIGQDLAHDKNQYEAALKARDSGLAQITSVISLKQGGKQHQGFLFLVPYYQPGEHNTVESRQKAFKGLVYAPFVTSNLMNGILDPENRRLALRISNNNKVVYDELNNANNQSVSSEPLYKKTVKVNGYGQDIQFDIHSRRSFERGLQQDLSSYVLGVGLVINALILLMLVLLARSKSKAVELTDKLTQEHHKRLEESEKSKSDAEQANRLKSSFLATMSHEIRTPLNGIMGMGQLLQREAEGAYQKKLTNSIVRSGELLLSIIESILHISKIESGLLHPDPAIFDIYELAEELEESFHAEAEKKGLVFKTDVRTTHKNYYSDKNIIKQILINLIGNALKFTDEGEVTLSVSNINDDEMHFSVIDTGIGIHQKFQDVIFERFRQVDDQNTRKYGGTGLGLSVTKDLVELMEGDISVSSGVGEGATFTFVLPLESKEQEAEKVQTDEDALDAEMEKAQEDTQVVSGEKTVVLLAEDNVINQEVIKEALISSDKYDVLIANDGQEALELLEKHKIDIVLMDIQMPKMTGNEAIRRIRNSKRAYQSVPVIVLTANAMKGAKELYLLDGADGYITKPVNLELLQEKIEEVIKGEHIESVA